MTANEDFMPALDDQENLPYEPEAEPEQVSQTEDELYQHHRFVVDKGQTSTRLDKFLSDRLAKVSRNKIQDAIRAGSVMVDNQIVKPNFKVKPNQTISIVFPEMPHDGVIEPDYVPLNIVYEDNDILVINKPVGLVCHPGVGNYRGTLVNGLAYYWRENIKPFNDLHPEERPGLVHRIDKDTSGLLVVAKNQYALTHLAKQFFYHTIERRYWAMIWGEPKEKTGTVTVNIGRSSNDPTIIMAFPEGDLGKYAVTHYKILEQMYYVTLVECQLETGRTHQIRVHMKHLGHPLFMDERYGGHRILKGTIFTKYKQFVLKVMDVMPRQSLHAKSLGFEHPTTGKWMSFESELPKDFQTALDMWRDYVTDRKALL
jgi:23S rRNA pseudouridine1911/1915/1917 synthase